MDLLHICQEEPNLIVSKKKSCYYYEHYLSSVPGAVSKIIIGVLNTSAVRITWSPVPQEEANGNITHYIVSVGLYEGRELYNRDIRVSSDLQVIVTGLSECFYIHNISLLTTYNCF